MPSTTSRRRRPGPGRPCVGRRGSGGGEPLAQENGQIVAHQPAQRTRRTERPKRIRTSLRDPREQIRETGVRDRAPAPSRTAAEATRATARTHPPGPRPPCPGRSTHSAASTARRRRRSAPGRRDTARGASAAGRPTRTTPVSAAAPRIAAAKRLPPLVRHRRAHRAFLASPTAASLERTTAPRNARRRALCGCGNPAVNGCAAQDVDQFMVERDGPSRVVGGDGPGPSVPSVDPGDAVMVAVVHDDVAWLELIGVDCRRSRGPVVVDPCQRSP